MKAFLPCFICGLIGHSEKLCSRIFDTPIEDIKKPYGSWMRAEPKRRNHTIGAKWLRQGGTIIVVDGEHGTMKSGIVVDRMDHGGKLVTSGIEGGNKIELTKMQKIRK